MKTIILKYLFIVGVLLLSVTVRAQLVGTWKTHMAYHDATIVVETNSLIFAVYDGSLLSYDPEYDEIRTYSYEDGLSDVDITQMAYSPEHQALILVYGNGNIDIFYGLNNVLNISSIKDKHELKLKTVNNINIIGDYAYLSAGFGVAVIDLKRNEIKETYELGVDVRSVCQWGDYLYAATTDGFMKGLLSTNLLDKETWVSVDKSELDYPGTPANLKKILLWNDYLLIQEINKVYYYKPGEPVRLFWSGWIWTMEVINNQLLLATSSSINFYDDFSPAKASLPILCHSICPSSGENTYWLASGESGAIKIKKEGGANEYSTLVSELYVNSPVRNNMYDLLFTDGKLLVTGGGKQTTRLKTPGTLMVLEDDKWYNFDDKEIAKQTGEECLDFMRVAVDPRDPNHYFVSSWGEGVYEFKDNKFVNLHTVGNSSLLSTTSTGDTNPNYVRVHGLAFDKNANLYAVNDEVDNGLSIYSASGQWKSYYYPFLSKTYVHDIFVDSKGYIWFNKDRGPNNPGVMVMNAEGTSYSTQHFFDQQGESIGATTYLCFAEDKRGVVWIGTDNGPVYMSSWEGIRDGRCNRIIAEDEYGDAFRLMEGVKVSCIAIDGGNRLWFGTDGSGVYMLDNTGSKPYVVNYTTANSLLVSDNIVDIAINERSGEVFVATDKGLMSYQSDAIEGSADYSDVYAYPNPVYPNRQSSGVMITGLMNNSDIKITDLSGSLIQKGTSIGGLYRWDCTDTRGETVKAGIYLVFAAQADGSVGVVTKIMVVK